MEVSTVTMSACTAKSLVVTSSGLTGYDELVAVESSIDVGNMDLLQLPLSLAKAIKFVPLCLTPKAQDLLYWTRGYPCPCESILWTPNSGLKVNAKDECQGRMQRAKAKGECKEHLPQRTKHS